ncbi:MAG: VOC family protein [Moraxellaceae bacterium]|nr:VOC family protein [Moraxellaceae bacterium]
MSDTPVHSPRVALKTPLSHIHHMAFRCRDAEQTRWFWEDVMGFPLSFCLAFDTEPGTGRPMKYMHLFFEMGAGNFIAFFDVPEHADEALFAPKWNLDLHIAFEVDTLDELKAWQKRLFKHGRPALGPVDHEFIESIYMYDPNGIGVEITVKSDRHDNIIAHEKAQAREALAAWTAETRALKEKNHGEKLDERGIYFFPPKTPA